MFDETILQLATDVLQACRQRGWKLATAESCTGGLICGALTEIAGSSDVVDRGFNTYSNDAKIDMLDVPEDLFPAVGAVSHEVAHEMALGALTHSAADISISVTGVAGPGASEAKPTGLVYIGIATRDGLCTVIKSNFTGDRSDVRLATVRKALSQTLERLSL
ncbi:CinA family protein [Aestuariispira insulae]|uniref:Nicotinamide-nucleotide amidase n=1 Tax=Aestuariispira insulae TaxID=1461337 RepID=A0A3D9HUZ8_9PROT|nr:CinA family protein [Aestuariispira insulae]RED53260.1 nicotinamide-nucleotide amidase [Aestuariispira insulae]